MCGPRRDRRPPGGYQLTGNLILQVENFVERTVHFRGPGDAALNDVDQPRGDAQLTPYPLVAARHHPASPELTPQLRYRRIINRRITPLAYGRLDPVSPDNSETVPCPEIRHYRFGDAHPDPVVGLLTRDVRKGDHRHQLRRNNG